MENIKAEIKKVLLEAFYDMKREPAVDRLEQRMDTAYRLYSEYALRYQTALKSKMSPKAIERMKVEAERAREAFLRAEKLYFDWMESVSKNPIMPEEGSKLAGLTKDGMKPFSEGKKKKRKRTKSVSSPHHPYSVFGAGHSFGWGHSHDDNDSSSDGGGDGGD